MLRSKVRYKLIPVERPEVVRKFTSSKSRRLLRTITLLTLVAIFVGVSFSALSIIDEITYEGVELLVGAFDSIHNVLSPKKWAIRTSRCFIPTYNYRDAEVLRTYFRGKPTRCSPREKPFIFDYWMNVNEGSSCISLNNGTFSKYYFESFGSFDNWICWYREAQRDERSARIDANVRFGPFRELRLGDCPIEEFLWINCTSGNSQTYEQPLALIVVKPALKPVVANNLEKGAYNVLVLGIDSLSRLNVHRQLPKTIAFLQSRPNVVELFGYNKIGLNSAPNQIALLTGIRYERPGLSVRVRQRYFDNLTRYLWDDFSLRGYRTMFYEEQWQYGLFVYPPLIGFLEPPTTYWLRPLMQAIDLSAMKKKNGFCIGRDYPAKHYLRYTGDTFRILGPKRPLFSYSWLSELAHDDLNGGQRLDDDVVDFFKGLEEDGILNHTAVFFISDHGMRFGSFRQTAQGEHEDRMPYGFIMMPQEFYETFPQALENLKINSHRLVTVYDLYVSILEIADIWDQRRITATAQGLSLFSRMVPENRTCRDAGIDISFCSCYQDRIRSTRASLASSLSQTIVDKMNRLLELRNLTHLCDAWELRSVNRFSRLSEGDSLTNFYRISITTTPFSNFEAVATYSENSWELVLPVDRTNQFSSNSKCLDVEEMKRWCYCKSPVLMIGGAKKSI